MAAVDSNIKLPPDDQPYDPGDGLVTNPNITVESADAIGDPATATKQSLIDQGYDPAKAAALAAQLLANAGATPSVSAANVKSITASRAPTVQATAPAPVKQATLADAMQTGIGIGPTTATTRTVTDDELVATQMEGLLESDSAYMRNARQRAIELANKRGQLGSSFAAGAAQRAAIESALPIATADAQAYRDVATANMNALNEFALANLQRATAIDTALLSANTNIKMANLDASVRVILSNLEAATQTNIANLDADTRAKVANLQSKTDIAVQQLSADLQLALQTRQLTHDVGMEQLQQSGRVELALMDVELQTRLKEMGFAHDFDMSELDQQEQLQVNEIINGYDIERQNRDHAQQRRTQHVELVARAQSNYISYITAYANSDMDAAAAARLKQDAWNNLQAEISMVNALYPEFPPISVSR